ncbi:hypothetical protein B0A52_04492 [Exophiala mesophila]|uniref:Vacuolar import and degradation protein 21 n=1 Tax=Exophiala mesophila TaxID=212818 RepID=A0A438N9M6_EXOME|nr:hypothetical protein B0A52_04492 [Exophiala mesophila]
MQRDLLRSKKSEVQSRLLSRKRKLAELYSVTAYHHPLEDPTYKQQLQAFHDANDLERGRLFDESTLPSRSPLIIQTRKTRLSQQSTHTSTSLEDPPESTAPPKTSLSPSSRSPVATKVRPSSKQPSRGPSVERDNQTNGVDPSSSAGKDNGDTLTPVSEENVDAVILDDAKAVPKPITPVPDEKAGSATLIPSEVATERPSKHDSTTSVPIGDDGTVAQMNEQAPRSPPSIATIPLPIDPQSSPASSNAPDSLETPAPTAGSPGTSPGVVDAPSTTTDHVSAAKDVEEPGSQSMANHDRPPPEGEVGRTRAVSPTDIEMTDAQGDIGKQSSSDPKTGHSQKPSMCIDTQTDIQTYFKPDSTSGAGAVVDSPAQMTTAGTPKRLPSTTPAAHEPSKRATRISSGVLQKKSVSEILGESPRVTTPQAESPLSSALSPHGRTGDRDRREKERSRMSTVVFAKPSKAASDDTAVKLHSDDRSVQKSTPGERDYLYTLFENKAHSMSRQTSMSYLIQNAHKTLSTADHLVEYELSAQCRILKRLYQLQEKQRWALRQYKRVDEVPRPTSHWDFVVDHVKWLRTDFKEERKWKMAAAKDMAECCAEWVESAPEIRKTLQVRTRPPRPLVQSLDSQDVAMEDAEGQNVSSHSTPELIPSNEDDSLSDDVADPRDVHLANAPAAIFALGPTDFNFAVDRTPAFDKLLGELPLYEPATIQPDLAKSTLAERLDAKWKTDIVPVSRWATEKLPVKNHSPPVKRSRYDYELEPPNAKSTILPPEENNVALFMPENKHTRDRIHPGHSFRPPSEHPMPGQNFFETRSSSQWTLAEDDELRKLVKDYSYNWSLISSCITPRSSYTSGADRRTPWECFERWIGLEGLPADMSKTQYFKTYSSRIEAAGRHVAAQVEEAQRRAGNNVQIPARKRTTQPVRVERKRTQRHLAMLDAMRKLAKKRETALQKQQHQADLAAMRKVNDANVPKPSYKTPAEFSQLKQEREQRMAERQEMYRQQLIAHQRATAQQQRGQASQPNGIPSGLPAGAPGMRGPPNGGMPNMPNANMPMPNGVARPHPGVMAMQGHMQMPPGMGGPKAMTPQMQAQMQAQMQVRGQANSPQQMRILQEASRVQQEQLMRQAQQAQNGAHSSPNGPHGGMVNGKGMNNAAYMAAMAGANGVGPSPGPMNGTPASPRPPSSGQALSSGHIPVLTQVANKIREHHPNMAEADIQRLASQQIASYQQQATAAAAGQTQKRPAPLNQAALNAAMGAVNAGNHASAAAAAAAAQFQQGHPGMMTNEQVQQFQHRMRMQQAQQNNVPRNIQGQMQAGMMQNMANGMNGSPVMNMARPVSQHANQGQMSRSATPRDQRAGSQSNTTANQTATPIPQGPGQQGSPRQAQSTVPA